MSVLMNRAITFVQDSARKAGLTMMKNSRYAEEWDISGGLLAEAAAAERAKRGLTGKAVGGHMATGVVFSFNRPVQLHLLLASYFLHVQNPAPLVVQYGAKGEDFEQAYRDVAKDFPMVKFVREKGFRDTLLTVMGEIATPKMFFLVDDDVFTRGVDMKEFAALDPLKVVPCLRMAPTLSYCYTVSVKQATPTFAPYEGHRDMLTFTWGEEGNEWDYPMSVEANLFDTAEVTVMTRNLKFKAPNTYEGALMRFAPVMRQRPGVCYALPKLMGIPCNLVQTEVANKAGDITPESLLAKWQAGEVIDPLPFKDYPNKGVHEEVPFVFKKHADKAPVKAAGAKKGKAA